MLGPNKWRLLTIVAGILLAHAIDSPSRSPRNIQSQSVPRLGVTIQRILPWQGDGGAGAAAVGSSSADATRTARNLYTPYRRFSNVDNVRFVEAHPSGGEWNWKTTFGAFRYAPKALDLGRRSDDPLLHVAISELDNSTAHPLDFAAESAALTGTTARAPATPVRRPRYRFIPLRPTSNVVVDTATKEPQVDRSVEITRYGNVAFPDSTAASVTAISTQATAGTSESIEGRRSGIQFNAKSPNYGSLFMPQAYQEDNPSHPNFQTPYSEELSSLSGDGGPETRQTRGAEYDVPPRTAITFPGATSSSGRSLKPFHDDVTKFGDVNGPVTVHRQFNDFLSTQGLRTYENFFYQDDYRHPRHYFPPKQFAEYSDYPGPPRQSRLIVPWKSSRTPRVVFPQSDGFGSGAGVSSYGGNDVVFRYDIDFVFIFCGTCDTIYDICSLCIQHTHVRASYILRLFNANHFFCVCLHCTLHSQNMVGVRKRQRNRPAHCSCRVVQAFMWKTQQHCNKKEIEIRDAFRCAQQCVAPAKSAISLS